MHTAHLVNPLGTLLAGHVAAGVIAAGVVIAAGEREQEPTSRSGERDSESRPKNPPEADPTWSLRA